MLRSVIIVTQSVRIVPRSVKIVPRLAVIVLWSAAIVVRFGNGCVVGGAETSDVGGGCPLSCLMPHARVKISVGRSVMCVKGSVSTCMSTCVQTSFRYMPKP